MILERQPRVAAFGVCVHLKEDMCQERTKKR